jgi:hypothetical protein
MKLLINHKNTIFDGEKPLLHLEAIRENESCKFMFENGWVPFNNIWYQTCSSRLELKEISNSRKKQINKINISYKTNNDKILIPKNIEDYKSDNYLDFFFDDIFWGRVNFYEDQIFYSVMNNVHDKKSYGTLSFYYLIDKYKNKYKYLYIADFFELFKYKANLPNFEFWNGIDWKKL